MPQFVRPDLNQKVLIQAPTIDPLSVKNQEMAVSGAREIVRRWKVDVDRPILLQVSRFDPWKDPLGVIDAYRLTKKEVPGVQLVMIGSLADDDPEGQEYLNRTRAHARGAPQAHGSGGPRARAPELPHHARPSRSARDRHDVRDGCPDPIASIANVGDALFQIDPDIRHARTLPARVYSDPDIFRLQRDRLFARTWHYAGHDDLVKVAGQVHPFTLLPGALDEPLLLTRDHKDQVH